MSTKVFNTFVRGFVLFLFSNPNHTCKFLKKKIKWRKLYCKFFWQVEHLSVLMNCGIVKTRVQVLLSDLVWACKVVFLMQLSSSSSSSSLYVCCGKYRILLEQDATTFADKLLTVIMYNTVFDWTHFVSRVSHHHHHHRHASKCDTVLFV